MVNRPRKTRNHLVAVLVLMLNKNTLSQILNCLAEIAYTKGYHDTPDCENHEDLHRWLEVADALDEIADRSEGL